MNYIEKSRAPFVAAVIGMLVMAIIASRQFYLFVVFRNEQGLLDPHGGRFHLWLTGAAALIACIAGGLMFLFVSGRRGIEQIEVPMSGLAPAPNLVFGDPKTNSAKPNQLSTRDWARRNHWSLEGQADDRKQMDGSVVKSIGSAPSQRAAARLTHQVMYKQWAKDRHD